MSGDRSTPREVPCSEAASPDWHHPTCPKRGGPDSWCEMGCSIKYGQRTAEATPVEELIALRDVARLARKLIEAFDGGNVYRVRFTWDDHAIEMLCGALDTLDRASVPRRERALKTSGTEPAEGGKRLDNRDPSPVHVAPFSGGSALLAGQSPAPASFGDHPLKGACAPSLDPNVTFSETVTTRGAAPNAGPATVRCFACATDMPETACSHWLGIGWSCTDRKACRVRRATPADPPTPKEALDGLFNGAVTGLGGVHAAKLFNIVRADLDSKYSRDEHIAALEAMEFSTRMLTIHECARWLEESEDLDLVAGRMSRAMRSAK